ncbi:HD domain-containing protein [Allopseudospirillum japonicum]|uniref:HD domain-containing protein n=1 Tax=Allopseudospirillum japonicum TaxID=64971 RepID=A0A1H6RFY6_9GAMM|nr:HD-GYP domain-containing protein [Allopseudospirillum japonicum]SEI50515.1 HD domain-containing protein [Allopseudospirillum japonicum]
MLALHSLLAEMNAREHLPDKLCYLGKRLRSMHPHIERFSVAIYEPETDLLKTFYSTSAPSRALRAYQAPLSMSRSLMTIARQRRPRILHDLGQLETERTHTQKVKEQGWCSSYTAPLLHNKDFLGFVFFNSGKRRAFVGATLQTLELASQLIALLIHQERLALQTLVAAVRSALHITSDRDPETGSHLQRMAHYTRLIASDLSAQGALNDREVEHLYLFAPLHDLGKIAIPDRILHKPARLTEEEFALMREHTTKGAQMVDAIVKFHQLDALPNIHLLRQVVYSHHETLDGKGYPQGLVGDQVPLAARIISVADIFDALTTARPYKQAWSNAQAFAELERMLALGKLDARCIQALHDHPQEVAHIQQTYRDDQNTC